jgi:hypothetical protein
MGRRESDEVPVFNPGSVSLVSDSSVKISPLPKLLKALLRAHDPYKYGLLSSLLDAQNTSSARTCGVVISDPVLLLTRMEYANLYHTSSGKAQLSHMRTPYPFSLQAFDPPPLQTGTTPGKSLEYWGTPLRRTTPLPRSRA